MQPLNETSVFESPGFFIFYLDLKRFEFQPEPVNKFAHKGPVKIYAQNCLQAPAE